MKDRIKEGWNKLIFCWNVTDNIHAFFTLVINTKRYKWNKLKLVNLRKLNSRPVKYALRFNNEKRNLFLRTYSGDLDIFYEIFFKKIYELHTNNNPQLIVDMGANIGLATVYLLNKYQDSKIISFEPDPENIEIFKKNLSVEIKKQKVIIHEAAIGNTDGNVFISKPVLKYNSKILDDQNSEEEKIEVKVININNFFRKYSVENIDILKIDIEGSEVQLFTSDITWLKIVREIIIEIHSSTADDICKKVLRENNFILKTQMSKSIPQIFDWVKS